MLNDMVNMALRGRLSIQAILHDRSIVRRAQKGVFRGQGPCPQWPYTHGRDSLLNVGYSQPYVFYQWPLSDHESMRPWWPKQVGRILGKLLRMTGRQVATYNQNPNQIGPPCIVEDAQGYTIIQKIMSSDPDMLTI